MYLGKLCFILSAFLSVLSSVGFAARIKDIAHIKGVRENPLSGYGIVIGLPGSGDKELDLTSSSIKQVLKNMGIPLKNGAMPTKNIASVLVTAKLPPFAKVGSTLDVLVSSVGTASSLEGGTLIMTPLKGADGNIYAMAQGKLLSNPSSSKNLAITAELPNGAIIEKEIAYKWDDLKEFQYQLIQPDFTTAARAAHKINEELAGRFALPVDAGTIQLTIPFGYEGTPVDLIALVEGIQVETDRRAKVVINSRTSTVVVGEKVRIMPVAIAHGNLSVEVKNEKRDVASLPPTGGAKGSETKAAEETTPAPAASGKDKKGNRVFMLDGSVTVKSLVDGLNATGASGEDLIAILRSIQSAGALQAELEIL